MYWQLRKQIHDAEKKGKQLEFLSITRTQYYELADEVEEWLPYVGEEIDGPSFWGVRLNILEN